MNCPYCDDSVHPMAKFCPKCGLPLSEEATLMGVSAFSESGPNRWMIAGGAVAIVAIAMSVGWMNSRQAAQNRQSVRRERVSGHGMPPGSYRAFAPTAAVHAFSPLPQYSAPGGQTARKPLATFGFKAQYAWTPPNKPQQPAVLPIPTPQPDAPRHLMAVDPFRKPARISVQAARPESPAIPDLPQLYMPQQYTARVPVYAGAPSAPAAVSTLYGYNPGQAPPHVELGRLPAASQGYPAFVTERDGTGARAVQAPAAPEAGQPFWPAGSQVASAAPVQDQQGDLVYDPVHETYVRRADRAARPAVTGFRGTSYGGNGGYGFGR
jgi:hypothetical protein